MTATTLQPGSSRYDEERTGFQLRAAHRPDSIVVAEHATDVQTAVRRAAEAGSRVAVQATGHGLTTPLAGGVLVSTRAMTGVRVDPEARSAWVEAGASWGDVVTAAAPYGLAPLSGSLPGVGAVSYTLGGGLGLLSRRYGYAADHIRRVDIVTADGELRRVTATEDPDLFWAVRGGGGSFGIVTGMEIGLFPVVSIYGGGLYVDVERVPDVLSRWSRWVDTVPEEMSSGVSMLPYPDTPPFPDDLRGRHVAHLSFSYAGPAAEGERLVEPMRALGPLLRDTVRELPFTESAAVFDEPDFPHSYTSANALLSGVEPTSLDTLPGLAGPSAPVMCIVGIRHLGGALARAPEAPNAVGHRGATHLVNVLSPVEPGQEEIASAVHSDVLATFSTRSVGRSANFSFAPLSGEQLRECYEPGDYQRLVALRAKYDPEERLVPAHPIPANP